MLNFLAPSWNTVSPAWQQALQVVYPTLQQIDAALLARQQAGETIYPPAPVIFRALSSLPSPAATKVVILGQDPYHGAGEANGLAFSVNAGIKLPPSLRNIYRELQSDLDVLNPNSGELSGWAAQGVLLLNSVLTVAADQAGSHGKLGWHSISDAIIASVNQHSPACVFILWGKWAQNKAGQIAPRHAVFTAAHPSPLSAYRGFFGSRPFSQANQWLTSHGQTAIDWARTTV